MPGGHTTNAGSTDKTGTRGSMAVDVKDSDVSIKTSNSSIFELSRDNSRYGQPKRWGTTSHFWANSARKSEPDEDAGHRWFIVKVYGILTFQILITIGIGAMCMYIDGLREGLLRHKTPIFWSLFVFMFFKLCCLFCFKDVYPINYFIMVGFTVVMSFVVGLSVAHTYDSTESGGFLILYSLTMTVGIFLGLTALMWIYKPDLYWMKNWLFTALWALILFGISIWILKALEIEIHMGYMIFCLFGIILFMGYICYDTSMIIHNFGPEDALIAAIELYLDVINLFLFILGAGGGSSD